MVDDNGDAGQDMSGVPQTIGKKTVIHFEEEMIFFYFDNQSGKLDVQGALIGIETGVLDGQDDGIRVRVVVV